MKKSNNRNDSFTFNIPKIDLQIKGRKIRFKDYGRQVKRLVKAKIKIPTRMFTSSKLQGIIKNVVIDAAKNLFLSKLISKKTKKKAAFPDDIFLFNHNKKIVAGQKVIINSLNVAMKEMGLSIVKKRELRRLFLNTLRKNEIKV